MGEELAIAAAPAAPAQQTATPPTEATPPATLGGERSPDGPKPSKSESVAAILRAQRGLGVQTKSEGDEPTPEDTPAEGEGKPTEAPTEEAPPPPTFDSFESVEAETDWTPEKIEAAANYLQQKQRKLVGHWKAADRRRSKAEESLKRHEQEKQALEPFVKAVNELRLGTQDQRLQALATLTGLPPSTALEMLATGVTDEMDHAASKDGQAEAKLAELERKIAEREQQEQQQRQLAADLRAVRQGFGWALGEKERWPLLCEASEGKEKEVVGQLTEEIWQRYQNGKRLTVSELCDSIEYDLLRKQARGPREDPKKPSPKSRATRRDTPAVETTQTTVDHRKKSLHTSESERMESVAAVLRRMRER